MCEWCKSYSATNNGIQGHLRGYGILDVQQLEGHGVHAGAAVSNREECKGNGGIIEGNHQSEAGRMEQESFVAVAVG